MPLVHRPIIEARMRDASTITSPGLGGPQVDNRLIASLSNGTGAGQVNRVHDDLYTVAAGATTQLDVSGGALLQQDGTAFTIAKLKSIMVRKTTGDGTWRLGQPAANGVPFMAAAGDYTSTQADDGSCVFMNFGDTGIAVTAGTGDLIDLVEIGAADTVTLHVTLMGTSA